MLKIEREIKLNGEWWFPEDPDNKMAGEFNLILGKEGVLTILDSSKDLFEMPDIEERPFEKIILGLSTEGKKITLNKCHLVSVSSGDVTKLVYKIKWTFVNYHFEKEEDIEFKLISVQYSNLESWANKRISINTDSELNKKPNIIPLTKKSDYKVYIDFTRNTPLFSFKEFTIKQNAWLMIETHKIKKPWEEFNEVINHMRNFLTLASKKPSYILKIEGKIKKNSVKPTKLVNRVEMWPTSHPTIEIYDTHLEFNEYPENIRPDEMMFLCDNLKSKRRILLNWLVNSSYFKPIYNTYFGTIYKNELFIENQFLNIITALEGYHRSRTDNKEIDEYSHKRRLESIISSSPSEYKKWIDLKLKFSNEPNLRKRLLEIMEPYTSIFKSKTKIKHFISLVVDNRNTLIHADTDRDINYTQLIYSTTLLKIVFEIYMLEHIGFEKKEIESMINKKKKRNIAFQYFKMN